MPNWTENTLVVQATTKKEIDDFLDEFLSAMRRLTQIDHDLEGWSLCSKRYQNS